MLFYKITLREFVSLRVPRIIVAICFLVFISSCASVDSRFQQAKKKNNVYAYDKFLKEYPDSKYTEQAKSLREKAKIAREARRAEQKKKREQRKQEREARKKQIDARKKKLSELMQKRIASGESVPEKPRDPGYPIVFCEVSSLKSDVLAINFPYTKGGLFDIGYVKYICGNTEAGKKVLHWRQWYCNDVIDKYDCVAGKWVDGEPTFSGVAKEQKEIIKMTRGQPELRYKRIQLSD